MVVVQVRSISPKTLDAERAGGGYRLSGRRHQIGQSAVEIGKAQDGRVRASDILRARAVAVDVGLVEIAEIRIRLVGPRIARLPTRARGQEGELVLRGLWNCIDARPVLGEKLDRGRGGGAEIIIGAGEGDVELGLISARAEIHVDAPQRRRRIIAPTGIVDRVGGDIAGQVSDLSAGLHRRGDAAI